jgi:hypothetical protein
MKKSFILLVFSFLLLHSCTSAQDNQTVTKSKLVGTWKAYKINMDETLYFIVYPNGKALVYGKDWEESQGYYLKDNVYYGYIKDPNNPDYFSIITYFDGKNMKYETSAGWKHTAEKVSETPVKVPYDPKIENHKHILVRSVDCGYCHNTCRMNCIFCGGYGGTYEPEMDYSTGRSTTRYKSCWHCVGTGKTLCLHCDCGRHD